MEDVVDDVTGAASSAVAIENAVNGKAASHDSVEVHAEEGHQERANGDNSGESEVINPPEEAGGEATSPPEGRKPRLSKGDQSRGPKVVKSKSPRSGDEGQARRRATNSSLPKKTDKSEVRSAPKDKEASLPEDSKDKRITQQSSVKRDEAESNHESSKPRKIGSTPSYGFTFKCDERSEKRREFYSKLEEKIHARELEISNMQAKSKETEEAELKMLRKSLKFKATPMPSFYKEPPPAKVELKKTPPTRARSPKLGRPKNKSTPEIEENNTTNQSVRLSLEDKVLHNGLKQSTASNSGKKPQRKSLPKLPSEETGPLDAAASTKVKAVGAQGTRSLTEDTHGTEMSADFVQGPIRAEVTPDEQEVSEHVVA